MSDSVRELLRDIPAYQQAIARGATVIPKPYIYRTAFTLAEFTAGVTIPKQINIQADADFILLAQTFFATTSESTAYAEATQIIPNASILLTDSGSGTQLSDAAVHVPEYFGNGQFPYYWPRPYYFAAKSTLTVTGTNNDTSNAYGLRLAFIGVKIYITSPGS